MHETEGGVTSFSVWVRRWRTLLPLSWARTARIAPRRWVSIAAIGVVCVGFFAAVQFATPNLVGNDGYFHIKYAALMRQQGLTPKFVWLPLTILNPDRYVDHHFLFHVLLIPFTFGDLINGAKWAGVVFAAAAGTTIAWVLHRQRVSYFTFWALGALVVSEGFIYRMSMTRVQSLSLASLLLALGLMLGGRHRWLLPLGFLYVWLYDAFPLLLMVCASYTVAEWLVSRRLRLAPLGYVGLGIALGLVLNPYFPQNLSFIANHFLPKLTETTSIGVGNEWFPYDTGQLMNNSGLALAAFASGALALGLRGRRMDVATATALILSLVLGFLLLQARRFVEYFPPFALIFAALAWSPLIVQPRVADVDEMSGGVPVQQTITDLHAWKRIGLTAVAGAALIIGLVSNLRASQESVRASQSFQRYHGAAVWLGQHSSAGVRVFQTDWDDFSRLFFYNTHNTYTIGLDPTYMQLWNPDLYALWVDLTHGQVEDLSASIRGSFGADYALSDLGHERFLHVAAQDPQMVEVYRDEYAVVFKVEPGPTP